MKNRHLRETVEIIGVISIVASLLLVAWEVRQANRIAAAQIEMQLAHGFNEMNMSRATTPDFARLFPKLNSPGNHLVTATEESQLQGLAWHFAGEAGMRTVLLLLVVGLLIAWYFYRQGLDKPDARQDRRISRSPRNSAQYHAVSIKAGAYACRAANEIAGQR
jgi:hypothetical protein